MSNVGRQFKRILRNQTGTVPVVELFLLVLAAALISLAVFASLRARGQFTFVPKAAPGVSPTTSASPTKATNEFDVPELGFKMTLPTGLSDPVYRPSLNQPGTDGNGATYTASTARFSSQSLEQAGGASSYCTPDQAPLGSITRYSFNPIGRIMTASNTNVKKVGSFYVMYDGPQGACAGGTADPTTVNDLQTAQARLMQQAFGTASAL